MTDEEIPDRKSFSLWDYLVFVGSLVLVTGIGVYYAVQNRRRRSSTKEVLLGSRQMGIVPIAMTLVATFVSAVSLLGYPTEIYTFGTMFYWSMLSYVIAKPIAAYVYLPVFYGLELTSAYQYLEIRFSVWVRLLASGIFCCMLIMYMSVVLYAPALALSSVIPELSVTASILTTGLLATFYTSLGGARAVVVTSTIQMVIIMCSLLAVVVAGVLENGGLAAVWARAESGGRIRFDELGYLRSITVWDFLTRIDPRIRHSVWSLMIGGTTAVLTLYSANQMTIQRYVSMPTLRSAQFALLLNIPINIFNVTLYMLTGLILYAEYENRDPLKGGLLARGDQILPYYVMEKLSGGAAGLAGLFVAALYSAGLSTLSGGLNAVAAVVLEDFVKPAVLLVNGSELDEQRGPMICQIIAAIFGLSAVGMAFGLNLVRGTVIQIAISVFGIGGGPLLGVFTLGMFFPWANHWGALVGIVASFAATSFVAFGSLSVGIIPRALPKYFNQSDYLQLMNASLSENVDLIGTVHPKKSFAISCAGGLEALFSISYQYYGLIGVLTLLLVGMLVSWMTGLNLLHDLDACFEGMSTEMGTKNFC